MQVDEAGRVIVDLAAEQGGNCELTEPGKVVEQPRRARSSATPICRAGWRRQASHAVRQQPASPARRPGRGQGRHFDVDLRGRGRARRAGAATTASSRGRRRAPQPPPAPPAPEAAAADAGAAAEGHGQAERPASARQTVAIAVRRRRARSWPSALVAPPAFLAHFTVFVLACFVGWQVVWNVTPALHTPLMSVTNAISGIIVDRRLLQVGGPPTLDRSAIARRASAILLATINIAGGFLVTQRMLRDVPQVRATHDRCPRLSSPSPTSSPTMLFILSLGGLSTQETARRGNLYGIVGMAIAVARHGVRAAASRRRLRRARRRAWPSAARSARVLARARRR